MSHDPQAREHARMRRAAAASGDGYWERDLRTDRIWYSSRFNEIFGFAPGAAPTDPLAARARIHPEDLPRYAPPMTTRLPASVHSPTRFATSTRPVSGAGCAGEARSLRMTVVAPPG
jgi:PAS domain-containing protein